MSALYLTWLLACTSDGPGTDGVKDGGPDTGPGSYIDTSCDNPIDVNDLKIEALPNQLLGRRFQVSLASESDVLVTCELEKAPPMWKQLVALQTTWRYTAGSAGTDWAKPSFDDSGWDEGQAPFAVNQEGNTLIVEAPQEPPAVTYFRSTFTVDDPAAIQQLRVAARRDDGIVVYVNGTEVWRDNVPVTEPMYGSDELDLFGGQAEVPANLLVAGENTIAVELHQEDGSGDATFDLRLAAQVDASGMPETHLVQSDSAGTSHTVDMYGLLADATYTCKARSGTCGRVMTADVVTEPLPQGVPALAVHPEADTPTWGTYTLFNHQRPCADDNRNRLVIVDPEGRPRWVYEIGMEKSSSIDIESTLISRDEILWAGGQQPEGSPQIVGLDGEVRYFSSYPGAEQDIYHHDVEYTPEGYLLGIAESNVSGGTHTWTGWALVEHDPVTQEETWRWRSETAFERGQLPPAPVGEYDPYHANALTSVDDAFGRGVYVSLLYTDEIVRIDRDTDDLIWHIGAGGDFQLVDTNGNPLPDDKWFHYLHGVNLYGDLLYIFDNGWHNEQSRAMAIRLDPATMQAELAWEWTEFGWWDKLWGDVDELPSGAVLVSMSNTYCHDAGWGHPGGFVEIDPTTNDVVWRADFLDMNDSTYRGERIDGCELFGNSRYCEDVAAKVDSLKQ